MNHSAVVEAFRSDHEHGGTAEACLQASLQLRRRLHRRPGPMDDEQVLLAVCHLLDALARGAAEAPVSTAVERAARRLAEQLDRADAPASGRES